MRLTHPLLNTNHGVYAAVAAEELDIPRLEDGSWPGTRVLPGVFSLVPPPLSLDAKRAAALLHTGPDGRITGLAAAGILGWEHAWPDDAITVVVPHESQVSSRGFVTVRRSRIPDDGIVRLGFHLASPARILAAAAKERRGDRYTALVQEAIRGAEVTLGELALLVEQHPRLPGAKALRAAVALLATGAESIQELACLERLTQLGLPKPQCQIHLFVGARLVSVADFWWEGVAVFYDGSHHDRYDVAQADAQKRDALTAAGLEVVVIRKGDLAPTSDLGTRLSAARARAAQHTGPRRCLALTKAEAVAQGKISRRTR